jgi:hypothetical protein
MVTDDATLRSEGAAKVVGNCGRGVAVLSSALGGGGMVIRWITQMRLPVLSLVMMYAGCVRRARFPMIRNSCSVKASSNRGQIERGEISFRAWYVVRTVGG